VVAGNSLGGGVAWRLATRRPDHVSGLVLLDAGGSTLLCRIIDSLTTPLLFQWGSQDEWLPPAFGRNLADQIPDTEFIEYDGVGHVPMEEAPDRTAADARAFVDALGP
jgi:pimeloyl-ACP methyl ester carboxylesterase